MIHSHPFLTRFSLIGACLLAGSAFADPASSSESFAIEGAVDHPRIVTLTDLQREPQTAETVFMHTGPGALAGRFTGVSLWTLLKEAGLTNDSTKKNDLINHFVIVTGSDGYSALLSIGEIAPEFGAGQPIVAYQEAGKPIEGADGFARLIVPGDRAAGRAVSAIASIEVK
ncbi:MAG: molybdopterin-binding oxidoreductase [Rhodospirillales bacterium]|nr:molybdopterin-binding oxidoreductase [Rhodospirillales bacterium]